MEYQQRLRKRRRGVLADKSEPHVGTRLWSHAAEAGARALGQPAGAIAVGRRADWLVLDRDHPAWPARRSRMRSITWSSPRETPPSATSWSPAAGRQGRLHAAERPLSGVCRIDVAPGRGAARRAPYPRQ